MKTALGICIAVIIILLGKILVMRHSVKEIRDALNKGNVFESNAIIGISSRDRTIRGLCNDINKALGRLREKYHKYKLGDANVKRAITNVSHDLRTPLTAICGYLEMIKSEGTDDTENLKRYLSIIENRALYMKDLTAELFEYSVSLTDSEETKPELSDVFVNRILEDCIMNYYAALNERNIEPSVSITDKEITRSLNAPAFERVLSNLMSNALKYSAGDLSISLTDDGIISFKNAAPSMTGAEAAKLFDRFYTVETGRNSTGLGLSIAKTLVRRMNGNIYADWADGYLTISIDFNNIQDRE